MKHIKLDKYTRPDSSQRKAIKEARRKRSNARGKAWLAA